MPDSLIIGDRQIGSGVPPLIVAELSGNHQQDFQAALKMIDAAASAGVDAIKLQTYTADSMTLDCDTQDFIIGESDSLWQGQNLYQLYQQAATPWEWHQALFARATELGLLAFSSPFDAAAVDFLEGLDVPCYKIASFELTDLPLLKKVARTGKPVILSTGMASFAEIRQAVQAIQSCDNQQIILLQCTSTYPAQVADSNIRMIAQLQQDFQLLSGLSDHTRGINVALGAVALGACLIEKHFVLDRGAGGVDAAFSIEPDELSLLVRGAREVFQSLGGVHYGPQLHEKNALKYRRSIYVVQNIAKSETFTEENIRVIRPAFGLAPEHYESILGKTAARDIPRGTALQWSMIA